MKTEFDEEEFKESIQRMLDYAKRTNFQFRDNLKKLPRIDLKPCKNCGRIVYVGKCCDKPDYEIEIIEEKQ